MCIVVFAAFLRMGIACSKMEEGCKANGVRFWWHILHIVDCLGRLIRPMPSFAGSPWGCTVWNAYVEGENGQELAPI